jgi:SAM-dependent methyltransferase
MRGKASASRRKLLALLPHDEPQFQRDFDKLKQLRAAAGPAPDDDVQPESRSLYRALVELTVAAPLGDLLDVGSGQGKILKLLASRARRAVGVDIDSDARMLARAELLLAGLPNCSLRQGSMYSLPFGDGEFDTVILDDVLREARHPIQAIKEAQRLLRPSGRLLLLSACDSENRQAQVGMFAEWCAVSGLRLAQPRSIPASQPEWLLAVATNSAVAAA